MKKYNVTIEQPMIFCVEIEAENIEEAEDKAKEIWDNCPIQTSHNWDYGTDAQINVEADDDSESTDWHDL